jgi:cytochrome c5
MKYRFLPACAVVVTLSLTGCGDAADSPAATAPDLDAPATSGAHDASSAADAPATGEAEIAATVAEHPPEGQSKANIAAGEQTYNKFCFSCHAAGMASAPKLGEMEDWQPRVAKGLDLLVQTSIDGIPPAMPPRGLCMTCSDEDLRDAVAYMIAQLK